MSADPLSTPEKIAKIKERERRAELRKQTEALLIENGIAVKTPEQRAAAEIRRREEKEVNPPKPLIFYVPPTWHIERVRKYSGPYADTVIAFARATSARTWACDGITHKGQASGHSDLIRFAIDLHIEQLWRDAGIVRYDRLVLDNLKTDSRCEVEQVIADTFAEWEAAGSPGLDSKAYEEAHRFLHGFIWRGDLPPYPDCPPPAHPFGIFPEWTHNQKDEHCPS